MAKFRDYVSAALVQSAIDSDQYFQEESEKKQIVLHHTASGKGVEGDIKYWNNNPAKISTCVLINYNGDIYQCFNSKFWGYHLGVTNQMIEAALDKKMPKNSSLLLNKQSIGIEIDNWGYLREHNAFWYAWPNDFGMKGKGVLIPESSIQFYPNGFKGYEAYEKYTAEQIKSTMELLEYWHYAYGIPVGYNPDVWDVMESALRGDAGTYTHNSFRTDKSDIHPDPQLIKAWQDLTDKLRK